MLHDILISLAGLAVLVIAGDLLVRGAVAMSLRMGISALIVSLTVVAFGTSAPELLIGVTSALQGSPGIALGNVVGSNIANILLVMGLPALISGIKGDGATTRKIYLEMVGVTALFVLLCFLGPLAWWHGTVLLAVFAVLMAVTLRRARRDRRASRARGDMPDLGEGTLGRGRAILFLVLGLVGLPLGAHFLIDGGQGMARNLGVSEEVIGLTLVAVGTSLPELATTVAAAFRGQADVAFGNAIGSNVFNILMIMGVTSFFGPLPVAPGFLTKDLWVMALAAMALAPFALRDVRMGKRVGGVFLVAYAAYMISLF